MQVQDTDTMHRRQASAGSSLAHAKQGSVPEESPSGQRPLVSQRWLDPVGIAETIGTGSHCGECMEGGKGNYDGE